MFETQTPIILYLYLKKFYKIQTQKNSMNKKHKIISILTSYLLFSTPALAVPGTDFNFYRADNNPTNFHTTSYTNGLTGNNAAAFQNFVTTEGSALDLNTINAKRLDSTKLELNHSYDVKVYFINESARSRNQLKIKSTGNTILDGMLFYDISCLETGCSYPQSDGYYTLNPDDVLELGDYISVGSVESGSKLDFELISPPLSYQTTTQVLHSDNSLNPNNRGVIAYEYEGFLILAWEDYDDGDYNDLVFAIDIGQDNLDCIPSEGELNNQQCGAVIFPD